VLCNIYTGLNIVCVMRTVMYLRGISTVCTVFKWNNHFVTKPAVACAHVPSTEAVRGWRRPNRPTVCTGARLCTGLGSLRFKERVC
jgi:hypothetical protein